MKALRGNLGKFTNFFSSSSLLGTENNKNNIAAFSRSILSSLAVILRTKGRRLVKSIIIMSRKWVV